MNAVAARILAVAGGVCVAGAGSAQTALYREVTATHLPPNLAGPCMDAAAGDADGDGDLDLALAMEFQPNILLLNDGAGAFADGSDRLPRTVHDSEDVAFADFDDDGDLDLVLVSEDDRTDELYINDGRGRFTDASPRLPTDDVSNALAVLDLDGDGSADVLTGNVGANRVLINDGQGNFRDETAERWPQVGESRTQDLELADVDGDGDLDVLVANEGQNELFLNEEGGLVDATERSLPDRSDESREIKAVDVDGDDDLDLVVANVRFGLEESPRDYLLLNDGAGAFTTADSARFPEDGRSNFTVQVVDLDGDGDMDVLAPSTVFPRNEVEALVLAGDGSGRTAVARVQNLDVRDVDDDGDIDVMGIDGDRTYTFLNDSDGLTFESGEDGWERTNELEEIDIDGDGDPDLSVTRIRLGGDSSNGADRTADAGTSASAERSRSSSIQIVDIDRDGDVDVVIHVTMTMAAPGDYLPLLNDGAGRFSAPGPGTVLPASADGNGFDVEVADFDDDGVTDLFFCNRASVAEPESAATSGGRQRLLLGEQNRD